jgi:hypothetical protein
LRFRKKYKAPSAIIRATITPATIPPMAPPGKEVEGECEPLPTTMVSLLWPLEVEAGFSVVVVALVVEGEEVV